MLLGAPSNIENSFCQRVPLPPHFTPLFTTFYHLNPLYPTSLPFSTLFFTFEKESSGDEVSFRIKKAVRGTYTPDNFSIYSEGLTPLTELI